MSSNTKNTLIFDNNTKENNLVSNEQSYDDLIGYCALRKQFSRIIPSYYTEIQKQDYKIKRKNISSIEEYKKLKEEISLIQESIELLKESKQKKLKEIEDLRTLMRKVGNKQCSKEDKKQINIIINNNYSSKEKVTKDQGYRCNERKGSNGFKVSSDEGLSLAPTTSGLSSGKDEDLGGEDAGQPNKYNGSNNSSNSSSGSWCFACDNDSNRKVMQNGNEKETVLPTLPAIPTRSEIPISN